MITHVIFDMDGTLLDTERLYGQAWTETGVKWGMVEGSGLMDTYVFYPNIIGRSEQGIRELFEEIYPNMDFDSFYRERMARYAELAEKEMALKPGCVECLSCLKEHGVPMALATSTRLEIAEKNLTRMGIREYFDAIVTGQMVERGKPAPDIFLEAGRRIGATDNSTCAVVEDAINGIKGAFAAHMKPIMVIDTVMPTDEIRPLLSCECRDLFDVMEFVQKENNK